MLTTLGSQRAVSSCSRCWVLGGGLEKGFAADAHDAGFLAGDGKKVSS